MKKILLLLTVVFFTSCFLVRKQYVKYMKFGEENNKIPKEATLHNFSDYKLYVFKMEEVSKKIERNNQEVSFVNGIDLKGERTVEEIYLFKNKDEVLYFTTESNKYSKKQDEEGYKNYFMFNTKFHEEAFFIQELDVVIRGEVRSDTIVIRNRALVEPNMNDDLKIVFKEYYEGGDDFLEFISLNNDHRIKKKRDLIKRVKIDTIINMKMKFKASKRKLAYIKKNGVIIQYVDDFLTYKNTIYFRKKTGFNVSENSEKMKYLYLKDRYRY